MKWAVFILCLMIPFVAIASSDTSEYVSDQRAIELGLMEYLRKNPRHPLNKPDKISDFSEKVKIAAEGEGMPPMLMLTVYFLESSFLSNAKGSMGEIGVSQVHGAAAEGCDLETLLGQMKCGARWMRVSHEQCKGNWLQTLSAYGSGSCRPRTDATKKMVEYRVRLWKKMEQYVKTEKDKEAGQIKERIDVETQEAESLSARGG